MSDCIERSKYRPICPNTILIDRQYMDSFYSREDIGPLAVFYWGTPGRSKKKFHRDGSMVTAFKGVGSFVKDPRAPESMSAPAYHFEGFDIGHMVPVEAMMWDRAAMAETWFTSNVWPQRSNLNRGPWSRLERAVFARQAYGTIGIIAGPIFQTSQRKRLPSGIAIPDAFFKIIFDPEENTAACYIMKNADGLDSTPDSHYRSLEEVCLMAGIAVPELVGYKNDPGLLDRRPMSFSGGMTLQGFPDYPVLENLFNGEYVLVEDYFVSPCDPKHPAAMIQIPAGFSTDMGSTPRFVWNLYPPIGTKRDPAFLLHDWMYATHYFEWEKVAYKMLSEDKDRSECDWRLLCALQTLGDSWGSRNIIYSAVRAGGWVPWKKHTQNSILANRSLLPA